MKNKTKEQTYSIYCDNCDKFIATINLQKVWTKYNIDTKGNYNLDKSFESFEIEEPTGDENLHLCKTCFNKMFE